MLTIKGARAATTVLERDTSASVFRILNVAATGTLTLQRLTIRKGVEFAGGGINNSGALTLIDSILTRNTALVGGRGGGINNSGTLTLINCILTKNDADEGGGLSNNNNGTVTITRTTFDGNFAQFIGGGLSNGVFSFDDFIEGGTVTVANSTFAHNIADAAGGLANFTMGIMTLTNTTVAQNVAANISGGGIFNQGILLLQSTTVAENEAGSDGGGSGILAGGIVLLQNTILARNDDELGRTDDCLGQITSLGNNLIGDPTGCTITLQPSDLTGDPGLGTFTDNGTPGNGHFPLLSTSQAIDAGNNEVCFEAADWSL